jgi:thiamine biosynthesis lipoprotein
MFLKKSFKLFIVFLLFSCGNESNNEILVINSGKAQGTFYHIKYLIEDAENLQNQIDSVLLSVDNSLSTYIPNSLISTPIAPAFPNVINNFSLLGTIKLWPFFNIPV